MNKLLVGTLLAFVCISSYADDLKVADDFKSGDLVSADTFNQIFGTLEQINRTVVDTDLVGVWSCSSAYTGQTNVENISSWTNNGVFRLLEQVQINLSASGSKTSLEEAFSFTSAAPNMINPNEGDGTAAFIGKYILDKNHMWLQSTKDSATTATMIYAIDLISPTRFIANRIPSSTSAGVSMFSCDSAEAVPASPTAPTATNNKTGINLAWTDASSDETGFKVYRRLSSETEAKVIATQTAVTYSDTDLTESQTAYYRVTAYNDNGDSAKSKAVSATLDNTAPTVVSTTPENNGTGSRQLRNVVVTFSEKIETVCPAGDQYTGLAGSFCPTSGSPVTFTAMVDGKSRVVGSYSLLTAGFGGSTTVSLTTMGSAERFDANQTGITVTVDKDWIRDANGVQMTEDFQFNFNVDASLDNPSCPPSC